MQTDLWQRRLGWVGLLGIILTAGGLSHVRKAAAEEADKEASAAAEAPAAPIPNFAPAAPTGPGPVAAEALKSPEEVQTQAMKQMQEQQAQIQQRVQAIQAENQQRMQESQALGEKRAEEIRALVNKRLFGGGESGKYWLGVECKEASPELRAQLGLDDGQGLVVVRIAPDSPAEKAGLKQHDVLVSVDDMKLARVLDLSKSANATDGKALELRIVRGGKEQVIAITPAQRAIETPVQIIAQPGLGMVMPGNMQMQFHLPDNLEVKIDRKGNEPSKITVKRGNESWEATADDLSKLPDDIRPFVQQMLGGFPIRFQTGGGGFGGGGPKIAPRMNVQTIPLAPGQPPAIHSFSIPANPGQPAVPEIAVQPFAPGNVAAQVQLTPDVMKRLDQMTQQLQQTQAELQRLREALPSNLKPSGDDAHHGEKEAK